MLSRDMTLIDVDRLDRIAAEAVETFVMDEDTFRIMCGFRHCVSTERFELGKLLECRAAWNVANRKGEE